MPATYCFSYPAGPALNGRNRRAALPDLPGLRNTPHACFGYPAAVPPDIRSRDRPDPPGGNSGSVSGACVSYPVFACFRY